MKRSLGEVWLERPWRAQSFTSLTDSYWRTMGMTADSATLDAIAVASWAAQVAGNLSRLPQLIDNGRWVGNNVERVVGSLV